MSETAFLIWKMRNERRIWNEDTVDNEDTQSEIFNRWSHAINKRLTIDRALTNDKRFGRRALQGKLVKATWKRCLKNEEELPDNWVHLKGVLVSISATRPRGRNR